MSVFWLDNPSVLYEDNNYLNFIPNKTMKRIEQLNAITRMMIYIMFLLLVLSQSLSWFQYPILVIIFVIVLFKLFVSEPKTNLTDAKEQNVVSVKSGSPKNRYYVADGKLHVGAWGPDAQVKPEAKTEAIIESGYYDSNGELHLGQYQGPKPNSGTRAYHVIKKQPTDDNPFMNPDLNETMDPQVVEPCNVDDDKIKKNIKIKFNNDLFQDVSDLFEKKNSERQFFTIPPQQMPPDTVGLANWLFSGVGSCKTDQTKCLRFEDLRYNPR
jgi:hypothetical protein